MGIWFLSIGTLDHPAGVKFTGAQVKSTLMFAHLFEHFGWLQSWFSGEAMLTSWVQPVFYSGFKLDGATHKMTLDGAHIAPSTLNPL